jgi:REP element-mobilizing transposase RayT
MWARGYFCAAVGAVDEETIKHYIEHHNEGPSVENFTIDGE